MIGVGVGPTWAAMMGGGSLSAYAAAGFEPAYVADFKNAVYRKSGAPTTRAGAITLTRAGNALMTDSDGVLKWAPHNLLTYSNDFSDVSWTKTSVTVTPDSAVAPDGTTTAWEVTPDTTDLTLIKQFNSLVTATAGVWVKDNGRGFCSVACGAGAVGYLINIDLSDGSFVSGRSYGGSSLVDYSITDAGNGWYLVLVTATGATSGIAVRGGDGVSDANGIYLWGAHLYRSDLGGMVDNPDRGDSYVPTTSAAVYMPRVGHHVYDGSAWVNEGALFEPTAATNLISRSNDFSFSVPWSTDSTGQTVTKDQVGPDGVANSATTHTATISGLRAKSIVATVANDSSQYTGSIYYKKTTSAASFPGLQLVLTGGTTVNVGIAMNTDTGVATARAATNPPTAFTVEDAGDYWRVSVTITNNTTGNTTLTLYTYAAVNADGGDTWVVSTGSCVIYQADLIASSVPHSPIPTSGSTVTRAADISTIPAANLPAPEVNVIGPELVTNGTFDTDTSGWTNGAFISSAVVGGQVNVTRSGTITASAAFEQNVTVEIGKVYLVSFDVLVNNGAARSLDTGPSGYVLAPAGLTGTGTFTYYVVATTTTLGINLWTNDATTSTFDNISVREINPLAYSIAVNGRMTYADTGKTISADGRSGEVVPVSWRTDDSNYISYQLDTLTSGTTGTLNILQEVGGVFDLVTTPTSTFAPGVHVPFNIASRHGSTFINGAVDGTALTADLTPVVLPTLTATNMSLAYSGGPMIINRISVWGVDVGDDGIAEAST